MREELVRFGPGDDLVGVLTLPDGEQRGRVPSPLVLLNAGMLHRVGPSRLYVRLARRLAAGGRACLRLDHSGVGDSPARPDRGRFDQYACEEARAAMDLCQRRLGSESVLVGGVCSAGGTGYRLALEDPRVRGVLCVNASVLREDLLTKDLRYTIAHTHARLYRRRIFSPRSWLRLLTGRSDRGRIAETLRRVLRRPAERSESTGRTEQAGAILCEELSGLEARGTRLLLLLSEGSSELDLQTLVFGPGAGRGVLPASAEVEVLAGADHVFTPRWAQEELIERIERWCGSLADPR